MTRNLPIALAALTLTLTSISTWLVCSTGALGNGALLFVH